MSCPRCNGKVEVINSRKKPYGRYRRYRCYECKHRFTTMEVRLEEGEASVVVLYALGLIRGRVTAQELAPTRPAGVRSRVLR